MKSSKGETSGTRALSSRAPPPPSPPPSVPSRGGQQRDPSPPEPFPADDDASPVRRTDSAHGFGRQRTAVSIFTCFIVNAYHSFAFIASYVNLLFDSVPFF